MGRLKIENIDVKVESEVKEKVENYVNIKKKEKTDKINKRRSKRFCEKRRGVVGVFLRAKGRGKFLRGGSKRDVGFRNAFLIVNDLLALSQIILAEFAQVIWFFGLKIETENKIGKEGERKDGKGKAEDCR